jgi:hypothetical protein
MKQFSNLEEKVKNKKSRHGRTIAAMGVTCLIVGAVFIYLGTNNINSNLQISADTAGDVVMPPTPADPVRDTSSPTPDGKVMFPSGWSMVTGAALANYDLKALSDAKLILYSFNDPVYANRDWVNYPGGSGSTSNVVPISPLGYYVYNSGTDATVSFTKTTVAARGNTFMFARGWHLLYWPNQIADSATFLNAVTLIYADGSKETLAQATATDTHMTSTVIYVVTNPMGITGSVMKQLTGTDGDTTISKVPQNSYFWIYLRRTKNRVTDISVQAAAVATPPVTATVSASPTVTSTVGS